MKQPLTDRQQEILDWVKEFIKTNSFPPSRSEIAAGFQFGSVNAADQHLKQLQKKGHIELFSVARGIKVLP